MSSPLLPSPFMYGDLPQGGTLAPMIVTGRAPSNTVDKQYAAGYFWLSSLDMFTMNTSNQRVYGSGNMYYQAGNSSGTPNWVLVGGRFATATGGSPQTVNARSFAVTFTGVSIAGGATQSFTIIDPQITATSILQISMTGATTGAGLSIQSVTPSAGQVVIVVQNATGASPSTANITFNGTILN